MGKLIWNVISAAAVLAVLSFYGWWMFIREPFLGFVFIICPAAALFIVAAFLTVAGWGRR